MTTTLSTHTIEFTDEYPVVNGRVFRVAPSLEQLRQILGPETRSERHTNSDGSPSRSVSWFWDDIGVSALGYESNHLFCLYIFNVPSEDAFGCRHSFSGTLSVCGVQREHDEPPDHFCTRVLRNKPGKPWKLHTGCHITGKNLNDTPQIANYGLNLAFRFAERPEVSPSQPLISPAPSTVRRQTIGDGFRFYIGGRLAAAFLRTIPFILLILALLLFWLYVFRK